MRIELSQAEKLLWEQAEEGDWSLRDTLVHLHSGLQGNRVAFPGWGKLRPLAEATVRSLIEKGLIELYRRGRSQEPLVSLSQSELESALRADESWVLDWVDPPEIADELEVVLFTTEAGSALYQTGITLK